MTLQKTSTVEITKRIVNGKKRYFMRTAVPKSIGIDLLGLNLEEKGQKLIWKADKGRIVVENSK